MENIIALVVIAVLVGCAVGYIIKEKMNGAKCIGCPHSGKCSTKGSCRCAEH